MSTTPSTTDDGVLDDRSATTTEQAVEETSVEPTDSDVAHDAQDDEGVDEGTEQDVDGDGQDSADESDESDESTDEAAAAAPAGRSRRAARTDDLVREGEVAADFLEALLDIADLAGDLEVDIDGNRAAVAIVDSEDGVAPRRLVGPGGQVLDALQELTRLAVQAETGDRSWLMLDVAGYRADRKAELVRTAKRAIEEVKRTGERAELDPMTAFERKVVHDEVLAAGLHSESEGADPSRYVVILPSA